MLEYSGVRLLLARFCKWMPYCNVALTSHAVVIYDGVEFPSSADLLMQRNWPIYQKQQKTELQTHRCIKNESAGPETERKTRRGEWVSTNSSSA